MKVAIIFSGIVRCEYKTVMQQWKDIASDFDYYYTTWNDCEYDFIDEYFAVPDIKYWPARLFYERDKDENPEKAVSFFKTRRGTKKWVYQQYAHAKAIDHFDIMNKYDVVIRARYDIPLDMTTEELTYFIDRAYKENIVVQLGVHTEDTSKWLNDGGKNLKGSPDFCFIHPANTFIPAYCYSLIDNKKLMGIEAGWGQVFTGYAGVLQGFNYVKSRHDTPSTV